MNMRKLTSIYSYRFPVTVIYMLQSCEYRTGPYLKWLWRTKDFSRVQYRRKLKRTNYAKMLLLGLTVGIFLELAGGVSLVILGAVNGVTWDWAFGAALLVAYPIVWAHLIVLPLELGRLYVVEPRRQREIRKSSKTFYEHKAAKIAVAGSYGKTTMKEVLKTVLSEGKKVAATEANHNVAIEHAKFATHLSGDEEVLIIEYGEGAPGDVARFSRVTQPTHGVITGLAPAHLDRYKTLTAAGEDIFSLAEFLDNKNVFVNGDSESTKSFIKPEFITYSEKGAGKWRTSDIKISVDGTSFKLTNGKRSLSLESRLLGRHQVAVLSAAAVLAMDLGLSDEQIIAGVSKTEPFEHRMQPYNLGGAWIIDDTYNGNIDGIKAGTKLLSELKANRKIYVTPGLVDQGEETQSVHEQMGKYIAAVKPEVVVLMDNSVKDHIRHGLESAEFKGELIIETDPLKFYSNLEQFVAAGDLVLMQNDWPDNYA